MTTTTKLVDNDKWFYGTDRYILAALLISCWSRNKSVMSLSWQCTSAQQFLANSASLSRLTSALDSFTAGDSVTAEMKKWRHQSAISEYCETGIQHHLTVALAFIAFYKNTGNMLKKTGETRLDMINEGKKQISLWEPKKDYDHYYDSWICGKNFWWFSFWHSI